MLSHYSRKAPFQMGMALTKIRTQTHTHIHTYIYIHIYIHIIYIHVYTHVLGYCIVTVAGRWHFFCGLNIESSFLGFKKFVLDLESWIWNPERLDWRVSFWAFVYPFSEASLGNLCFCHKPFPIDQELIHWETDTFGEWWVIFLRT